jgi:hypothetical protein
MFGISDPGIYLAYLLVFLCTAFAVIYGIINWNKGGEIDKKELEKDIQWEKKEKSIKKKLTD